MRERTCEALALILGLHAKQVSHLGGDEGGPGQCVPRCVPLLSATRQHRLGLRTTAHRACPLAFRERGAPAAERRAQSQPGRRDHAAVAVARHAERPPGARYEALHVAARSTAFFLNSHVRGTSHQVNEERGKDHVASHDDRRWRETRRRTDRTPVASEFRTASMRCSIPERRIRRRTQGRVAHPCSHWSQTRGAGVLRGRRAHRPAARSKRVARIHRRHTPTVAATPRCVFINTDRLNAVDSRMTNDTKGKPRRTSEPRCQLVPHDHTQINVADQAEVAYWCAHFQCTGSALRAAVAAVGPSSRVVASHLRGLHS
jgi:uncharacterized protein DUF3606